MSMITMHTPAAILYPIVFIYFIWYSIYFSGQSVIIVKSLLYKHLESNLFIHLTNICLFIWLHQVFTNVTKLWHMEPLVVARKLSCGIWDPAL